jgi:hypothetical protein
VKPVPGTNGKLLSRGSRYVLVSAASFSILHHRQNINVLATWALHPFLGNTPSVEARVVWSGEVGLYGCLPSPIKDGMEIRYLRTG